jgi:hypothetical protein
MLGRVDIGRRSASRVRGRARLPTLGLPPLGLLALALALLTLALLAGCGGSSGAPSTSTSSIASSTSPRASSASGVAAIATVSGAPIARSSYEHWLAVEKALGSATNASHKTLGFLITTQWVRAEAAARGIAVSEAEVKRRLTQIEQQSFPKAGALQKFLSRSGESEADLRARVKVELLESRIAAKVTAGKSAAQRKALLTSFQQAFQQHWKRYTTCAAGYVMEDCAEYKGGPEGLNAARSPSG